MFRALLGEVDLCSDYTYNIKGKPGSQELPGATTVNLASGVQRERKGIK